MSQVEQLITDNLDVWTSAIKKRGSQGRGSSKKIELYGIKKLRELILDLAVRGLLVPQDPNDEPASVLIEKINAKKVLLIEGKKIKKQKKLPEIMENEKTFELPQGWEWTKVGDISLLKGGYAYKSKEFLEESNFQLIRMGNIRPNIFRINENSVFITPEIAKNTEEYEILSGDILLTMTGTKGKRDYLYSLLVQDDDLVKRKLYLNQRLCICRALESDSAYLNLVMKVDSLLDLIYEKSTGTANQANIGMEAISNWVIPFPGRLEQKRIVAKVDELMALCDQLEQQTEDSLSAHQTLVETLLKALLDAAQSRDDSSSKESAFDQAWQRIAEHFDVLFTTEHSIDQLKQTILQLAVMGKLVPQDPNDEPASVLLEKIAAEKKRLVKEGKIKKQKPLPEIGEDEKPFELPVGWEWCRFIDIAHQITDGAHHTPKYTATGVPFLSVKDMSSGSLSFRDTKFVSEETHQELIKRCNPKKGDLLLTKIGTTGVPVLIDTDSSFSIFVSVALIKFSVDYLIGSYLCHLINSPLVKEQSAAGTQGVGNKNLVLKTISAMLLAVPPKSEQLRIVEKVDALMSLCDSLKSDLRESQMTQLHLADAMAEHCLVGNGN